MSINPTLSADWYINPSVYESERQAVFGDSWVHVGYDCDLPNIGDVLRESIAEVDIEIIRSSDTAFSAMALIGHGKREPVLVDLFRGMIFVALDTKNCSLGEWLDQFPTALAELPLEKLVFSNGSSANAVGN